MTIFQHETTFQVIEVSEIKPNEFIVGGTPTSLDALNTAGWKPCQDPGYRGMPAPNRPKPTLADQTTEKIVRTSAIMPNTEYIADHICRIEGIHANHPLRILNSKWRIASNADLFPTTLAADGTLTPEQVSQVDAFIDEFKRQNPNAIAQYTRRAG